MVIVGGVAARSRYDANRPNAAPCRARPFGRTPRPPRLRCPMSVHRRHPSRSRRWRRISNLNFSASAHDRDPARATASAALKSLKGAVTDGRITRQHMRSHAAPNGCPINQSGIIRCGRPRTGAGPFTERSSTAGTPQAQPTRTGESIRVPDRTPSVPNVQTSRRRPHIPSGAGASICAATCAPMRHCW